MRNIYFLLGLATSILSTSCMEIFRPQDKSSQEDFTEIPLSDLQQQKQNYLCTANEPGWKKLNDIANGPYSNNKAIVKNPTDLEPIYRTNNTATTTKRIENQEKKPFLQTPTSLDPDTKVMQKLYSDTYDVTNHYGSKYTHRIKLIRNLDLSILIESMNDRRNNNNINEDRMGQFAYHEQSKLFSRGDEITTIFFSCLKRYRLTIESKPEELPYTCNNQETKNTISNEYLAQALGITDVKNTKKQSLLLTYTYLRDFPAYLALADSFINIFRHTYETRNNFATCLHSDEKIVFKDYLSATYVHLKNEFYKKAHDVLCHYSNFNTNNNNEVTADALYNFLQIIETAKLKHDIKSEKNLGYDILGFEPTTGYFDGENYSSIKTKNRISFFCQLIGEYNRNRAHKTTPTGKQYDCYRLKKETNAALPDSFTSTVFDENIYAFKAFKKLIKAVEILIKISDETVQLFVNKVYHQGK